jgi:hypothetical protein
VDIPRIFNITESAHRIHNPITPEKLATLGAALRLESGARVLDLGSGSQKKTPFSNTPRFQCPDQKLAAERLTRPAIFSRRQTSLIRWPGPFSTLPAACRPCA